MVRDQDADAPHAGGVAVSAPPGERQGRTVADKKQKVNVVKAQRATQSPVGTDAESGLKVGRSWDQAKMPPLSQSTKDTTTGPRSCWPQLPWPCCCHRPLDATPAPLPPGPQRLGAGLHQDRAVAASSCHWSRGLSARGLLLGGLESECPAFSASLRSQDVQMPGCFLTNKCRAGLTEWSDQVWDQK